MTKALYESNELLRLFIDSAKEYALYTLDKNGKIVSWNAGAERLEGYTKEEILGKQFSSFYSKIDQKQQIPQKILAIAAKDGQFSGESYNVRKDGTEFWTSVIITPLRSQQGALQGFVNVIRDITEKKVAQQEISQLTKQITDIMESISDGFFSLDKRWRFTYFNKNAEALLPYQREKLLGKTIWELYPAYSGNEIEDNFRKAVKQQETISFTLPSTTGKVYKMHCYPSPSGLSVFFTDVTAETELMRRQSDFISIASHELRAPLTNLQLYAELLEKQMDKKENKPTLQITKNLINQVNKLTDLANNILDTSTIQTGKIKLSKTSFDLNKLIVGTIHNSQSLAINHTISFEGGITQKVIGDKIRITQVITNLIHNAVKYSPQAKTICVKLTKNKINAIVSVQDFGVGITVDKQDQIFTRFFRTEKGIHAASGLGLGLFISQNIIESHGGKIWVESDGKHGSIFFFTLPLDKTS